MTALPRYAIYWAPDAAHPLWKAGCDWLGRDPETGWAAPQVREHASEPRRYGFHATLKAPMALRDGVREQDLLPMVADLASATPSFAMPPMAVSTLRGFIALRPVETINATHPLRRLADACVRELDALRRPSTNEERERRLKSMDFDATERANIEATGYAFVFDRWQFHMTLSDSLPARDTTTRDRLLDGARQHFANALAAPLRCSSLSVFIEPAPGQPFQLMRRLPLAE